MKSIKYLCILFSILLFGTCAEDIEVFTGNIMGKVTDAQTGEYLQGVSVTITPTGNTKTTGSNGTFEFLNLEPKQYEIQAKKDGYISNNKTVTVITGSDVSGDIQLTPVVKEGVLALSINSLNFGSHNSSLSFNIQNNGNKRINWNISELKDIDWFSISPTSGTIEAGKSNAVVVTLKRNRVTEYKEATIIINADNESLPLKITAETENKNSKISLSTNSLNFGTEYNTLAFDIKNIGNAGNVDWEINGIDVDWLTASPISGTTAMDKSSAVKVNIDRSKLEVGEHSTTIFVNADGESLSLRITAEIEEKFHKIELDKDILDFGADTKVLTFNIKNVGNAGSSHWEIKDVETDWIKINPISGTTAMGKSSTVKVEVDRNMLEFGKHSTTITVESDGESFIVTINAEKADNRYLVLSPMKLDMGTETSKSFSVYSYNGPTTYKLHIKGDADWAHISPTEGVLQEYIPGDNSTYETFTVEAIRDGLSPGEYSFTIIIRTEMGDYELPVSINVESTSVSGKEEIITCNDNLKFLLTSCTISGTTATLSYTVENTGNTPIALRLYGADDGRSYIYDDQGNKYDFGYNKASLTLGTSDSPNNVSTTIPVGVKVKGTVKIYNVDDYASRFANITVWSYSHQANLIFKNVAIQGRSYHEIEEPQTTGTVVSCSDDLEFTLLNCKCNSSNTVTVTYRVANITNKNVNLRLYGADGGRSYIYDDQGNKYDFGYNKASLTLGTSDSPNNVYTTIPENVFAKGSIVVKNVDELATELSNVTVWSYSHQANLIFKNVKIRK